MGILKLRLSMLGTLALIIGMSTLFFTVILMWIGVLDLLSLAFMVIFFNVLQWLFAPYIIGALYRVREVPENEMPRLHALVKNLSQRMRISAPKLMLASIPIPNAFAYGSPLTGNRIAVTEGLLKELEEEEVEAVLGHEMGHIKHRDVQTMMFVSVLPAIFYYIGYSLMWSSMLGGRDRREGSSAALIGFVSIALYWILTLFVLGLSRLREYYADRTSAENVDDGARKLSEALAKIVTSTSRMKSRHKMNLSGLNSFKALLIDDPNKAESDTVTLTQTDIRKPDQQLVKEILSRPVSSIERVMEILSTHPNIVKRLRALQNM